MWVHMYVYVCVHVYRGWRSAIGLNSQVPSTVSQIDSVEQGTARGWLRIGYRCIMGMQRMTDQLLYKVSKIF